MQTIHLTRDQVPEHLRRGSNERHFVVRVAETVFIPSDAGTWSGGSRSLYAGMRLSDGASVSLVDTTSAPWSASRQDQTITLRPGFAVVEQTMFCGKNMPLRFYVRPEDAAPLLPAPVELSDVHRLVLAYTAGRKSSYNGQDRYDMAKSDHSWSWSTPLVKCDPFPTREQWAAAKAELAERGLLTKQGAITPAGRNVIGSTY